MKIIKVLFILICVSSIGFSQSSNVVLFSENGEKFTVILNGERMNDNPQTNVRVSDLNADSYKAKIIFEDASIGEINKNLFFAEKGNEFTYSIKQNRKGKYVVRFVSQTPVSQTPPPPAEPKANTQNTTNQQTVIQTTTTETVTTNVQNGSGEGVSFGINVNDNGSNVNVNMNISETGLNVSANQTQGNITTTTTSTQTVSTTGTQTQQQTPPQQNYLPGYTGRIGCEQPMSRIEFSDLKNSISSKTFEDSKLTIAKQVTGSKCLLSSQVREIMKLFTYEDTRLEFAKYAYSHTYDIDNYYKVNDTFEFELTIDELNEFIQK